MELVSFLINGIKTIVGVVFPSLKKKYFDRPKIYIKLSGNSGSFRGVDFDVDLYQNPQNMFDPMQIVYCEWRKEMKFYNNSDYHAYNLKIASNLDSSHFKITPTIDYLTPLKSNENITYTLTITDTYKRKKSEAKLVHQETDLLKKIKISLEYTNVKGTKFYTMFENAVDLSNQNQFARKYNSS